MCIKMSDFMLNSSRIIIIENCNYSVIKVFFYLITMAAVASKMVCICVFIAALCQWAPRPATDSSQSLLWTNWTASMREVRLHFAPCSKELKRQEAYEVTWQLPGRATSTNPVMHILYSNTQQVPLPNVTHLQSDYLSCGQVHLGHTTAQTGCYMFALLYSECKHSITTMKEKVSSQ